MKRVVFIFGAVFLILAISVFVHTSSAFATGDPVGCTAFGGTWVPIDGTSGKCKFSSDHPWSKSFCPEGYSAQDSWKFDGGWTITKQTCVGFGVKFGSPSSAITDVTAGSPVDAWYGNCGAYISNPPWNGTVKISKGLQRVLPNVKGVCSVDYYDSNGTALTNFRSPGWVYYNLDKTSAKLWEKGDLAFYVYQNGAWTTCSNTYFVDAGAWGRLSCYSSNPVSFGIGTGIVTRNPEVPGGLTP